MAEHLYHFETLAVRILIVDRNRDAADTLCQFFCLNGHSAFAALSDIPLRLPFDAAIIDAKNPRSDGCRLAMRLRQTQSPEMLLVATLCYATDGDLKLIMASGFNYYIYKPYDPKALFKMIVLDVDLACRRAHQPVNDIRRPFLEQTITSSLLERAEIAIETFSAVWLRFPLTCCLLTS